MCGSISVTQYKQNMTIHETIKNQIKDAMRAKDAIRLDVLRGLTSAFSNEMIAKNITAPFIDDASALTLIKRSVKQHRDSIDQFDKGGRKDLSDKERAELVFLEAYLPATMSQDEIRKIAEAKLGGVKLEKAASGKFMGELMKELKGKADGADVKMVVESLIS